MRDNPEQPDAKPKVIHKLEDLPDFEAMSDDDVVAWWEQNEVSAEILTLLEDTGKELNFDF